MHHKLSTVSVKNHNLLVITICIASYEVSCAKKTVVSICSQMVSIGSRMVSTANRDHALINLIG